MIATVSGVTIDLSQLVSISMDSHGGAWGYVVVLTMKPTIQYVQNPETKEWELHSANIVIEQPCLDYDVQQTKYEKWLEKWSEYKEITKLTEK